MEANLMSTAAVVFPRRAVWVPLCHGSEVAGLG